MTGWSSDWVLLCGSTVGSDFPALSHLSSIPSPEGVVGAQQITSQPVSSFFLFSTALWELVNSRPVYFLTLFSHLFFCLPCLLPPFTVPCKMVLARPDERETCPYHFGLRFFTRSFRRSSCGPTSCRILAQTSSLVIHITVLDKLHLLTEGQLLPPLWTTRHG